MLDRIKYGAFYWCIKVDFALSNNGEIYVYADRMIVNSNGDLICESKRESGVNLAVASGQWLGFYAASCIDGGAVAVEHWEGEVIDDR